MTISRAECVALDVEDPIKHFRDEFVLPDGTIYLVGNSLGAPPRTDPGRGDADGGGGVGGAARSAAGTSPAGTTCP